MKSEQIFYLKLNLFVLGFLVLQVPHKLKVSIISIDFVTDFCLKSALPAQHSKYVLKKTLKSPTRLSTYF